MRGLTEGTILAVHPPAGSPDPDRILGHVKIPTGGLRILEAKVENCGYPEPDAASTDAATLPAAARCEPVLIDLGDQRMKVALEVDPSAGLTRDASDRILRELKAKAQRPTSLFRLVDDPTGDRAEWLVRFERGGVYLVLAADLASSGEAGGGDTWHTSQVNRFGPAPAGEDLVPWVDVGLTRIARVASLRRLAANLHDGMGGSGTPLGVEAQMLILEDRNDPGKPLGRDANALPSLRDGDLFTCQISNTSRVPVDVSILFIGSDCGIDVYYPDPASLLENRLPPSKSLRTSVAELVADRAGVDQLLVIAVASPERGQPVDFSALSQPGVEDGDRSESSRSLEESLDRLFPAGLRQVHPAEVEQVAFRTFTSAPLERVVPAE